jgi:hypothetical protein
MLRFRYGVAISVPGREVVGLLVTPAVHSVEASACVLDYALVAGSMIVGIGSYGGLPSLQSYVPNV